MRIVFERVLEAPPGVVWEWITRPERMSEWSSAPVIGGGGNPDKPGFERVVMVKNLGVRARLVERVLVAERPHRYVYVVARNRFVRTHRAEQQLAARPDGTTQLRWTVDMSAWIPGLMHLFVWLTRPQLERSLDALAARVRADRA
jgi:uncharacterized protein YndB with AHSA1/START domain